MTVRTRLIASFAAVAVLLLVPGLFAASQLSALRRLAVERRGRQAAASLSVGRLQARLAELDRYERSYVATGGRSLRVAAVHTLGLMYDELDSLRASPYARPSRIMDPMLDSIVVTASYIHDLVRGGRLIEATDSFSRLEPLFSKTRQRLRALADSIDRLAQQDFVRAGDISDAGRRFTLGGAALALLAALLLAAWTTRALTDPLQRLADATAAVAAGNLEAPQDLPYARGDEIGALSSSFLRMTRRLRELDRMKAEFVGVASHELKTPINVINGYAELIEEGMVGDLTDHQRQVLDAIAEQTQVMSRLVSRLMDISRLEVGSYRMEFERIHLQDLVTGLLRSFDVLARARDIDLRASVDPSAPETVVIDVDLIRDEVLGNLVSNALRHTPVGGRVEVSVRGDGANVVFEVSDSGPGVPEEHGPHIFDKYYQAARSRAVGTGLGLAIAREMVKAHHGFISLEPSGPGEGARFRVSLPTDLAAFDSAGADVRGGEVAPLVGDPGD